jgi:hypothetical protein
MTPPAAAAAPRTRTRRHTAPPRRVSGPARGRAATTVHAPPRLAVRVGGAVHGIAEHHLLERITRGRAWIAILGIGLIGIVFMQVSMLRMNAGIGSAVERTGALERQNSALRASISELSSGDRIGAEATQLGLVMPSGTARFLDARGADAGKAVASMTVPGEGIVPSASTTTTTATATGTAPVLADTGVAPNAELTAATTTADPAAAPAEPAAATTTAAPATSTTAPAAPAESSQTAQPVSTPTDSAPPGATGGADASGQVG